MMPGKRRHRFLVRLGKRVALVLLVWLVTTWTAVFALRFVPPTTSAYMIERQVTAWIHGNDDFQLHYRWVPWQRISKQVPLAMVASEDQRFPFHHGFDIHAIRNALQDARHGERLRGASTISQQTARNLFLWPGRSWVRKGLEAYFTVLLEVTWPKQRILEVYANIAELGDGVYGVGAASRRYYHRNAARIGRQQAARMAAVLPNPKHYRMAPPSAYVRKRAQWIQKQMRQLGGVSYITTQPRHGAGLQPFR